MEKLSYDIGPRPPASEAMGQAQIILGDMLRDFGADNIHTEPVSLLAWHDAPSQVQLLLPRQRSIESIQHVNTAAGDVTADLLDAGVASNESEACLGKQIEGKIVLLNGHEISGTKYIPLQIRIRQFVGCGAVAIIIRNQYPLACPAIELCGITKDMPVPVVGISFEDAEQLSALSRREQVKLRIQTAGKSEPAECTNLVADLGPSQPPDETIVLSAHLDTFHVNAGSLDNLTGVVTLMEMVQALAGLRRDFERALRLIIFTGEEYGFLGSKSYVERHADQLDCIRFVFNMDTLFDSTAEGVAVMWSPAMRDYIDRAFQQTQCQVDVRNLFCMSSDYLPFMLAGVPTARPAHLNKVEFPPWSHTRLDTPDKITTQSLHRNAMAFSLMLLRMLTDPQSLPAERLSPNKVRELLAKEDVVEALRVYNFEV